MINKKILFSLLLVMFSVAKIYSCPLCAGRFDPEQFDSSKSNRPGIPKENVKKYFPEIKATKPLNLNGHCKDPKDQKCKNPEELKKAKQLNGFK